MCGGRRERSRWSRERCLRATQSLQLGGYSIDGCRPLTLCGFAFGFWRPFSLSGNEKRKAVLFISVLPKRDKNGKLKFIATHIENGIRYRIISQRNGKNHKGCCHNFSLNVLQKRDKNGNFN